MTVFDSPEPISVSLELGVADLRITATERVDTVVEVEPSDPTNLSDVAAAKETSAEYADGVLRIRLQGGRSPAERSRLVTWGARETPGDRTLDAPWPGQIPPPAPAIAPRSLA